MNLDAQCVDNRNRVWERSMDGRWFHGPYVVYPSGYRDYWCWWDRTTDTKGAGFVGAAKAMDGAGVVHE